MTSLNCFKVHDCQMTDAERRKPGFPKPPGVMPKALQNTRVTIISREDFKNEELRNKLLPPIRYLICIY